MIGIRGWIIIITLVALSAAGYAGYQHYTGLITDLQEAKQKVTQLEENLRIEKETTKRLTGEVDTANRKIELTKELYESADKIRTQQLGEIKALNTKVKELTQKLPTVIPIEQASPESPEELNNSLMRILTLWDVYCETADHPPSCGEIPKGESS